MKKIKVSIKCSYEFEVADSVNIEEDNAQLQEAFAEYLNRNNISTEIEFWENISFEQVKK